MQKMYKTLCIALVSVFFISLHSLLQAQTLHQLQEKITHPHTTQHLVPSSPYLWTVPISFIVSGTILLNRLGWFDLNSQVKEKLRYREYKARYVDDVLQFLPMTAAISLDTYELSEYKNWRPLVESASSIALMVALVHTIKFLHIELRPDNSAWNSFPSGHTATAFVGAELLRQKLSKEYWYISLAGYTLAACTAYLRIYHNRHWLGDTLAGAGLGIAAAWLGTTISRSIFNASNK